MSKKDLEDIQGVEFDSFHERLAKTSNYLYPKHVEVIEDIAPIAGAMVDEIVSFSFRVCAVCVCVCVCVWVCLTFVFRVSVMAHFLVARANLCPFSSFVFSSTPFV